MLYLGATKTQNLTHSHKFLTNNTTDSLSPALKPSRIINWETGGRSWAGKRIVCEVVEERVGVVESWSVGLIEKPSSWRSWLPLYLSRIDHKPTEPMNGSDRMFPSSNSIWNVAFWLSTFWLTLIVINNLFLLYRNNWEQLLIRSLLEKVKETTTWRRHKEWPTTNGFPRRRHLFFLSCYNVETRSKILVIHRISLSLGRIDF